MVPNASLDDLIEAAGRGDRAAFRALYREASAKLFGLCLRICRERPVAEDAMQDAFVDIWRKAAEFDPARGAGAAWMAVIARNRAIDLVRRRARAPGWGGGGEADAEDPLAALADPKAREDGGAEAIALAECLSREEEKTRSMLVLAYVEGLSREELSAKFDAPVNTVKTWLRRGLASLKTCLDG
ncbi:MAG: sigma-70 family RNA polymerase sigma factor [Pikeienuella sp.]